MLVARSDLRTVPSSGNEVYWDALNHGRLMLRQCCACKKAHFQPRQICPFCHSTELSWRQASGRGEIYAVSVTMSDSTPYAYAMVTLEEGPTMTTHIVDVPIEEVRIGQAVVMTTTPDHTGKQMLPVFRPIESRGANPND